MASIRQHRLRWRATVRIPQDLVGDYNGRRFLSRHLPTSDRREAKLLADAWEAGLRMEWGAKRRAAGPTAGKSDRAAVRAIYEAWREEAARGAFKLFGEPGGDPTLQGIDHEIDKLADAVGERELTPAEGAQLAALQDAAADAQRQPVPKRPDLEPTFAETAADYLELWKVTPGLRDSNTRQQKEATFRLFAGHLGDRPIRDVRRADVAGFVDQLRRLEPSWARSPRARSLEWPELVREFGGRDKGLSDATVNRHVVTLQEVWRWSEERGRCEGTNPFGGHRRRLRPGVNVRGYLPWEHDELARLFNPPPARHDLLELMLVGLFSGLRLDEIASLTYGQLREAEGVKFIQVEDAKTPAGRRQVPIHPRLAWLAEREGEAGERLWPTFNPEGPGKKPGADAGREFSRFKVSRGFTGRERSFHSFRKNVTQCFERAGVPMSEAAQILGHAREFSYATYSPHGITLERKAEIIGLIDYPDVPLPEGSLGPGASKRASSSGVARRRATSRSGPAK